LNIIKQRASFPSSSYSYRRPTCYATTTTTTNCWPLHIHREMMITKKEEEEGNSLFSYHDYNYRERDSINKIKRALLVILLRVVVFFLCLFCFFKKLNQFRQMGWQRNAEIASVPVDLYVIRHVIVV
jgi:hypothetical protein